MHDTPSNKVNSSKSVSLPKDLFAHRDVQTEWWYYTGHLDGEDGRKLGFELVFFKRRTDADRVGVVPLRLIANPMYAAHFAVSDVTAGTFRYEHRRSFGTVLDPEVRMSDTRFDVAVGDWRVFEDEGFHVLHASLSDGTTMDTVLMPAKEPVLNGYDGVCRKAAGESTHFSITRMAAAGRLIEDGRSTRVTGAAWMDREFGTWHQQAWDWFSIQLDDGTELMIYEFRDRDGVVQHFSNGTFVDANSSAIYLSSDQYSIEALSTWKSLATGAVYPHGWRIRVPSLDVDLEIAPNIADQELDTRGTTMVVYWEGSCSVKGARDGEAVHGRAYTELVGYDRSHERLDIGTFLFGNRLDWLRKLV